MQEGQAVPDFKIRNDKDEEVSLSDFHGQNVVLYFYPKDNSSGWTNEAIGFRDLKQEFKKLNAVIWASVRTVLSPIKNFCQKNNLTFTLLSDENKEVVQLYDVWKEKSIYGRKQMGVERNTFVIDKNGTIQKIFPKVKVPQHPEAVLDFEKKLD